MTASTTPSRAGFPAAENSSKSILARYHRPRMVTVRPPLWDRAYALAGAFAIAGLFLPMALLRAPASAPPPEVMNDPAVWNEVESRPPSPFYGDDGIFLNKRRPRESVNPRP
jgi:hypothetical protein